MANEGSDSVRFVQDLLKNCSGLRQVCVLIILDKVSRDNTRELLDQYALGDPRLRVVWAPENRCVVDAYIRGYGEALKTDSDWILEIDAGFSHDPSQIPRFFEPMLKGCDCAFGSRFMTGGQIVSSSWRRRIVSYGGSVLTNLLIGTSLYDMTSGFEIFTRATLEMILAKGIHSRAHFFQTEIKIHCRNLQFVEVPITYRSASPGLSTASLDEAFNQLWRLLALRVRGKLDEPILIPECTSKPASL